MLTHLNIKNYALIDELNIAFSDGLTIITGETGAGKSILLGALSLIIGQRADTGVLQDKTCKCIVEATFRIKDYLLEAFFKQNELDYADETLIRREISTEGKSRAFVNDTPVTLSVLKELGEKLIDIHSQHETMTLNESAFQLELLDVYAGQRPLLSEYQKEYRQFMREQQFLNELVEREIRSKKDLDYFKFQFEELEDADLKPGEQIVLEQELEMLNNAEEIKLNLSKAHFALSAGDQNILVSLNEVKIRIANIGKYNPLINELNSRLTSSWIELKDIASELENLEQEINYQPDRTEELTLRLDTIYRLQNKHQVKTIEELIHVRKSLEKKIEEIDSLEGEINRLTKE